MDIEKTLVVSAPREQVWGLLLDPQVMGGAVPGMKSIEVISPTEYVAVMHQKIAFISAKFKLRTHIVEQRAPEYLRVEGTGEDASVASSLKQSSEVFLESTPEGGTELRIKVNVTVLGRLGSFGLSVMKTKADRMWDEFGRNLKERIESGDLPLNAPVMVQEKTALANSVSAAQRAKSSSTSAPPQDDKSDPEAEQIGAVTTPSVAVAASGVRTSVSYIAAAVPIKAEQSGWWSRFTGRANVARSDNRLPAGGRTIRVEVRQFDKTVTVDWPLEAADQCREWLRELAS